MADFPRGVINRPLPTINTLVTTPTPQPADNSIVELLKAKTERLEAAMMEIGSLKAQLLASQEKSKLLEDRSKRPWWRRFLDQFNS